MVLTVYTLEQSEQWDNIVRSFKHYDTYWLSGYVKTFQIHGDGDPLLFFYDSDGTRGINVVMKRDVAKDVRFSGKIETGKYFDFSTPYGYGGWLIEGENIESLFLAYPEWINGKFCDVFIGWVSGYHNNTMKLGGIAVLVSFKVIGRNIRKARTQANLTQEQVAAEVFDFLCRTIERQIEAACEQTGCRQALLAGGVASSTLLREMLEKRAKKRRLNCRLCFARPELSGDNAVGVALLGAGLLRKEKGE